MRHAAMVNTGAVRLPRTPRLPEAGMTTTAIQFHTEATYTVDVRAPANAKPITTQEGDFQPNFLSLSFTSTLCDGTTATQWNNKVSISGPRLDGRSTATRCTYLPWGEFIPDWVLPHIEQHSPNHITLRADGPPASPDARQAFALLLNPGEAAATSPKLRTSASIRHSVWTEHVQSDELIEIPGAHPGSRSRWIKPDSISVAYQWMSDLSPLGGDSWLNWTLADLSITGMSVRPPGKSTDGEPSGRLRAPLGIRPEWTQRFIVDHEPDHIYLHCSA
jgi:hypothetical protein